MGRYLNPSNTGFRRALNSPIYVDKTGMIEKLNQVIHTNEPMICVSRPRRFGKSMAVYSRGCDSRELFQGCAISRTKDFEKYLNKYDVIRMDMQLMVSEAGEMVRRDSSFSVWQYIMKEIVDELKSIYPEIILPQYALSKYYDKVKLFLGMIYQRHTDCVASAITIEEYCVVPYCDNDTELLAI